MAKVKQEKNVIKANVSSFETIIKANVSKKENIIKGNVSNTPSATTKRKGIIRIATDEEAIEGVDKTIAITPFTLKKVIHYTHFQGVPSNTWVVEHNLNRRPNFVAVDSADSVVMPDKVDYNDDNKLTLYFLSDFTGKVYIN